MGYGDYPDLSSVKKILVIKLRHLGDVLLTTPLFTTLKKALPHASLHAYVYRDALPLLEGHPAIDALLTYDPAVKKRSWPHRLLSELSLWRRIRKEGYDLVLNLTEGDRGALAAKLSRAPLRVGFPPKGKWQRKLYTHLVKHPPSLRHTVEKNLDLLRRIGLFPTEEERALSLPPLPTHSWSDEPFILIHPTSRWRFKCWPIQKMRALTVELLKRGKKVIFSSGPDPLERQMVADITRDLPVTNLAGTLTLLDLASLIDASECLLCVDSLPLHLASALKKRVVALFGPTSDITWGPWQNPHATLLTHPLPCRPCHQDGCGGSKVSDCLVSIPVNRVLEAILEEDGKRSRGGLLSSSPLGRCQLRGSDK